MQCSNRSRGLVFTNLVDFDMLYGHRNDVKGYGEALTVFDNALPELIAALGPEDLLIVTADHGCDPATPSTDHSRNTYRFLRWARRPKPACKHRCARYVCRHCGDNPNVFGMDNPLQGTSFYQQIVGRRCDEYTISTGKAGGCLYTGRTSLVPKVVLVLGSGLGDYADRMEQGAGDFL